MITVRRCFQVDICCRLVKRDDILEINLIYFSPHHKNKFVNSVNSLNNSLATLAETKEANMLDFTWSGLPNVSQSKSKFTTFMSSVLNLPLMFSARVQAFKKYAMVTIVI